MVLTPVQVKLRELVHPDGPSKMAYYFKTGKGQYSAHDQFIGVTRGKVRQVAHKFEHLAGHAVRALLHSPIHEERLLALLIWVRQFQKGTLEVRARIYKAYMMDIAQVNNWDLVDFSAPQIVGAYLHTRDQEVLHAFSNDKSLWKRRIAIVATQYFIKKKEFSTTIALSAKLLTDHEDLIHKAVGWTLREMGKQSKEALIDFLDMHATQMPRTMLRYALERLDEPVRKDYMKRT